MNPNLEMLKLLDHVFKTLDALIEDYGVYLYLVFVWLALAALGWILSGGLRRKQQHGNAATVIPAVIILTQPPTQPEPPIVGIEVEQVLNDDDKFTN